MEKRLILITRNTGTNKFWSRAFGTWKRAIESSQILTTRKNERHEIIGLVKGKNNGHRWTLYVWEQGNKKSEGKIILCSKKEVIFVTNLIKRYDKDLCTTYIKNY